MFEHLKPYVVYDLYHVSPLIQEALSVRSVQESWGFNLVKFDPLLPLYSTTDLLVSSTCPEASSREDASCEDLLVLAAEHSGVLAALMLLEQLRRTAEKAGTSEWEQRLEGCRRAEVITSGGLVLLLMEDKAVYCTLSYTAQMVSSMIHPLIILAPDHQMTQT